MKKTFDEMSSSELFALAQQRAIEEREAKAKLREAERQALLAERREHVLQQRAELKALQAEHMRAIKNLEKEHRMVLKNIDKKLASFDTMSGAKRRESSTLGQTIIDILDKGGRTHIRDIKNALTESGFSTKHLNQNLAYLKRVGRIESTGRGVYQRASR